MSSEEIPRPDQSQDVLVKTRSRSVGEIHFRRQTSIVTEDGENATVSEIINAAGFGWYQVHVFILSSGFIVAEGACVQMASGISNAIDLEYNLQSYTSRSALLTLMFMGLAVGTISSGPLGDEFGRRYPICIGYAGITVTSIIIAVSQRLAFADVLFFFLGTFAGVGVPAACITLSEVTPDSLRGISTAAMGIAFSFGELWAALGLRLLMPDLEHGPWHMLVLWASAPAALLLLLGSVSKVTRYDTPHFLAGRGKNEELIQAVNLIARMNGHEEMVLEASKAPQTSAAEAVTLSEALRFLAKWPMALFVIVQCALFFSKDNGFYGMAVFWPLAWGALEGFGGITKATELILTASLGVPGVGVAMVMIYFMPRRMALALAGAGCAAGAFLIRGLLHLNTSKGVAGVVLYKLCFPTWQMITMLLPSEVFPTQVRVWAWSLVGFFGRLATILAPAIVNSSKEGFLDFNASMAIASAVLVWTLNETKDCKLQNFDPASEEAAETDNLKISDSEKKYGAA